MKRKTIEIINSLKKGDMKLADAAKIAGPNQLRLLCDQGCVERYESENPDYAKSSGGQRPMCIWVRLGSVEYVQPVMGNLKTSGEKGIARAIMVLERAGYKVTKIGGE